MPRRLLQRLDAESPVVLAIAEVHRAGGFTVPVAGPLPRTSSRDGRAGEVEVRWHRGCWQYRRPGRRGAWAQHDPDAAALQAQVRRYLAELAKVLRPAAMARVRACIKVDPRGDAKARRHAAIAEAVEALGLGPCPPPDRNRPAMVANLHRCTARHVRAVVAAWKRKKSGTG